jgi:hypothetical protein
MGWRDLGKLAKTWLENETTELVTTDRHKRETAARESDHAERQLKDKISSEVGYAVMQRVLPPDLAAHVAASRPENVAARRDSERRQRLAALPTAALQLTITGALNGRLAVRLPIDISQPDPDDEAPSFAVDLEAPDLLVMGSDTFAQLTVTVPHYRGPGRYDLVAMWRRAEAGEIDEWDLLETSLRVHDEGTDVDPCWYPDEGIGVIEVGPTSMSFDLGMVSAAGSSRATGSIDWSPQN